MALSLTLGAPHKTSIQRKISWVLLSTSCLTLLFAVLIFVGHEIFLFQKELKNDIEAIKEITKVSVSPALEFNDPKAAHEFVNGLKIYPSLIEITLYDKGGELFARYIKGEAPLQKIHDLNVHSKLHFSDGFLQVFEPLYAKESNPLGYIFIRSDFRAFKAHLKEILVIAAIIFLLALLFTVLIAKRFQKTISKPILSLYDGVLALANRNFSLRVPIVSEDELGELSRAFNQMIEALEQTTVSKDYVTNIMTSMTESLMVLTKEGHIKTVNRALLSFLGYSEEELMGKSGAVVFSEGQEPFLHMLQQVLKQQEIRTYDLLFRSKSQELIPVALSASMLKDDTGHFSGFVFVATDVRDLKRLIAKEKQFLEETAKLEREKAEEIKKAYHSLETAKNVLARKTDELTRSNRDLEQFAYVASHDLQEPLRMVASYMELIVRRYSKNLDADAKEFIEYAVDGANRMKGLIQDLLAYSRVGTQGGKFKAFQVQDILSRLIQDLTLLIQEAGASVTYDEVMPTLIGDEQQLLQVLTNLVNNAIKFRGEAPLQIHISVKEETDEWVFSVKDNGLGIKKEFFDRIFVIFQRLHARDKYPGTGIGLAICKRVIERHHGRIWLESEEGKGSTFYFSISKNLRGDNGTDARPED